MPHRSSPLCTLAYISRDLPARVVPTKIAVRVGVNSLRRMFASARNAGKERGIVAETIVPLLLGAPLVAIAKVICDRVESLKPAGELPGR